MAYIEEYYVGMVKIWVICRRVLLIFCSNALIFLSKSRHFLLLSAVWVFAFRHLDNSGRIGMTWLVFFWFPYLMVLWLFCIGAFCSLYAFEWALSDPLGSELLSRKPSYLVLWRGMKGSGGWCSVNQRWLVSCQMVVPSFQQPFPPAFLR